jgi:HAD domain in Swiss Army Knife RNA repair proteins
MRVLYLGISGTLHPSASTYELVHGRSPWDCGHCKYEAVPWLASALAGWVDVRIVLTSTQPRRHGLPAVLEHLGMLAERVIGYTFDDLTTKVVRRVRTRSGTTRQLTYSSDDYWRLNKADIVTAHVEWLKPETWVAVDDEDILWPKRVADHVCIVDGLTGLQSPAEQDRLLTYLDMNFGRGGQR